MTDTEFQQQCNNLFSSDATLTLISLRYLRRHSAKLLSFLPAPEKKRILEQLIRIFDQSLPNDMRLEAACILTNWACNGASMLIWMGAVEKFMDAIESQQTPMEIQSQAVWCIGNIAGDSMKLRNYLLRAGVLDVCGGLFFRNNGSIPPRLVWSMANLCCDCHQNDYSPGSFTSAITAFCQVLGMDTADDDSIFEACRGLRNLTDGAYAKNNCVLQHLMDAGCPSKLLQLISTTKTLKPRDQNILTMALAVLGNLVLAGDKHTQIILNTGALPVLRDVLGHSKSYVAGQTCWILSNIAAGTELQRRMILKTPGVMAVLILEGHHSSALVRQGAAMTICNMLIFGGDDTRRHTIDSGGLRTLCEIFFSQCIEYELLKCTLDAFRAVFGSGSTMVQQLAAVLSDYGIENRLWDISRGLEVLKMSEEEAARIQIECNEFLLRYF